ncbi:hypothetical protein [Candidatus Hamiltonella endosymbiont of Tuberolachnus salignus]|uniref:hypothetical protein n=1 Tax=Candidatus Williamhamiltonella endosymbiont of Tuberolachnus salignus TaxID=3077954 RepID=UPI0030D11AC3
MQKKDANSDGPVRRREERQRLETQWREERKKGGVVLSVPKVLLHRPTREYSLDNRMLYRVWCGCFGQKVIVKDLTKILQHQADRHH